MIKPMSDEKINGAFDGDFGEISFDHYPTPEDLMLIKLKLVALAAQKDAVRQVLERIAKIKNDDFQNHNLVKLYIDLKAFTEEE